MGSRKVAAAASISVTGNIHRGSRSGGCDPSFVVMERNLERIEGAKETGIHPVAGGKMAGDSETPAARRAARVRGGACRRLSRPGYSLPMFLNCPIYRDLSPLSLSAYR
jgi:hypothetical protein